MFSPDERERIYVAALEQWQVVYAAPDLSKDELIDALIALGVDCRPLVDTLAFTDYDAMLLKQLHISAE